MAMKVNLRFVTGAPTGLFAGIAGIEVLKPMEFFPGKQA
jgi:hypothetical protein